MHYRFKWERLGSITIIKIQCHSTTVEQLSQVIHILYFLFKKSKSMIRETEKALRNNNNPLSSIQPLMADIGRIRMVRVTYNHENGILYRASTYNTQILNALFFFNGHSDTFVTLHILYFYLLLDDLINRQVDSNFDFSANFSLHDFRRKPVHFFDSSGRHVSRSKIYHGWCHRGRSRGIRN